MAAANSFFWAILAALCWGIAPLFEKAGLQGTTDPLMGVFVRSLGVLGGALVFLVFWPRLHSQLQIMTLKTWFCLAIGGLLASIIGQACFYRALKVGELSKVVPIGASYPVIACLLGLLFLKEPITWAKGCGILLVVVGTFLLR